MGRIELVYSPSARQSVFIFHYLDHIPTVKYIVLDQIEFRSQLAIEFDMIRSNGYQIHSD